MISLLFTLTACLFMLFFTTQITIPWMVHRPLFPMFKIKVPKTNTETLISELDSTVDHLRAEQEVSDGLDQVIVSHKLRSIKSELDNITNKVDNT